MKISFFIKVLLLVALSTIVSNAKELKQAGVSDKKSLQYYKSFKKEWDRLPLANKKRIIEAYSLGKKDNMGLTMAATRFLENKGAKATFDDKDSISKNVYKDHTTYSCGAFGINTNTYLESIGIKTKKTSTHLEACKKLSNDKSLNTKMAKQVYNYALDKYNGNLEIAWNYYNTGRSKIINDRIYEMKALTKLISEELPKYKTI